MQHMRMLIVMTAMVFVAAGSARGSTSPGPPLLDSAAVMASRQSSLPMIKGEENLSRMIFPAARYSTVGQLFVEASAQGGKADDKTVKKPPPPPPPPPRSTHCPPDKDDQKGGDNQDKDKCGKDDDGKNP
jgi:hypothetical protein